MMPINLTLVPPIAVGHLSRLAASSTRLLAATSIGCVTSRRRRPPLASGGVAWTARGPSSLIDERPGRRRDGLRRPARRVAPLIGDPEEHRGGRQRPEQVGKVVPLAGVQGRLGLPPSRPRVRRVRSCGPRGQPPRGTGHRAAWTAWSGAVDSHLGAEEVPEPLAESAQVHARVRPYPADGVGWGSPSSARRPTGLVRQRPPLRTPATTSSARTRHRRSIWGWTATNHRAARCRAVPARQAGRVLRLCDVRAKPVWPRPDQLIR